MKGFNHSAGQYLHIEGAKIYYEEAGNKSKPTLLLLHGGFGTINDFDAILPTISDKFRIIGIDSRGHGKSTLGKQILTYARIQLDVEDILKSLHIDRLNIIGFSDGGIVAYRLATYSSLYIEKLVTVGSRWNINDALLSREMFLKITPENWRVKFPDTYANYQRLNPEADFNTLTASIIKMWLDTTEAGYPNENVDHINCPTLIVRGDKDHLLTGKSVAELRGLIKNSALLNIPFAGHGVFQDQLTIFNDMLNQFMQAKKSDS
jgi:pimeloyl-ACP methyl ester carboxylesterase